MGGKILVIRIFDERIEVTGMGRREGGSRIKGREILAALFFFRGIYQGMT